jgi:hypothetical protein
MRGKLGSKLTINGDMLYDLAKINQSVVGYDFILHDKRPNVSYLNKMSMSYNKMLA